MPTMTDTSPQQNTDDLADVTFSPETVDYAVERAERAYPHPDDFASRLAYARGFEDGLRAAEAE